LDSPYQKDIENILQTSDMIIFIEHCCNCASHNGSLRHDPQKYFSFANLFLCNLSMLVHSYGLNIRLGVIRSPIKSINRIGAFEVFIFYRDQQGVFHSACLHSKLATTLWPSILSMEKNMKAFFAKTNVPLYSNKSGVYTSTGDEGLLPYPIGFGSWEETPISKESWTFECDGVNKLLSSTIGSPGRMKVTSNGHIKSVQWVFDSREHSIAYEVFTLSVLSPLKENNPSFELMKSPCISIFESNSTSICIALDEVVGLQISHQSILSAGGELNAFVRKRQPCQLTYSIDGGDHSADYSLYIDAVILPGRSSLRSHLVKMKILLQSHDEDMVYKYSIYGRRNVRLGGPDGVVFFTFYVDIEPPDDIRPPQCFQFCDIQYNRPILLLELQAELHHNNINAPEEQSDQNGENSYELSSSDGLLYLPTLKHGLWSISFNPTESYLPLTLKFLLYNDCYRKASEKRRVYLKHRLLLSYMIKPKPTVMTVPKCAISVYPLSSDMYVDVVMLPTGNDHEKEVYCGSFRNDSFLSLASFMKLKVQTYYSSKLSSSMEERISAKFRCTAFILPTINSSDIDDEDLRNGSYSEHPQSPYFGTALWKYSTDCVFKLREMLFDVTWETNTTTIGSDRMDVELYTTVHTPIFDSMACNITIRFIYQEVPVAKKKVDAYFHYQSNSKATFAYSNVFTDDSGTCFIIAPSAGLLYLTVITDSGREIKTILDVLERKELSYSLLNNNKTVSKSYNEAVSLNSSSDCGGEWVVNIVTDSLQMIHMPVDQPTSRPILLLGDISGSMGKGKSYRMNCLKSTFLHMFESAVEAEVPIALVAWCSWNFYCAPDRVLHQTESSSEQLRYLTAIDRVAVEKWVDRLQAQGGNNMRFAIEDAMNVYPDAKDVYIFCDGDVRPFTTQGGSIVPLDHFIKRPEDRSKDALPKSCSWTSFCRRYPAVKFHFIAIDKQAEFDEMGKMSFIGGGSLTLAIK